MTPASAASGGQDGQGLHLGPAAAVPGTLVPVEAVEAQEGALADRLGPAGHRQGPGSAVPQEPEDHAGRAQVPGPASGGARGPAERLGGDLAPAAQAHHDHPGSPEAAPGVDGGDLAGPALEALVGHHPAQEPLEGPV